MQEPRVQLAEILRILTERVMLIDNAFYIARVLFDAQQDERVDDLNFAVPFFVTVRNALVGYVVLELNKLFDQRERRGLTRYLEQVREHFRSLGLEPAYLSLSDIESQIEDIRSKQEVIDKLLIQRDKFYAHADPKYFGKEANLSQDAPLSLAELGEMIRVATDIIQAHYSAFFDTALQFPMLGQDTVSGVLQAIRRYRRAIQDVEIHIAMQQRGYLAD